jgi:acetate kinase
MTATILTLNAGSSSVKFQVFSQDHALTRLAEGGVSNLGTAPVFTAMRDGDVDKTTLTLPPQSASEDAVRTIIAWVRSHDAGWEISAVAHRIVHGGTEFTTPIRATSDIFHQLKLLIPLAPLHQPHNLAALGMVTLFLPHVPQIACFDTAFHAGHDALFTRFAIPQDMNDKGVRRYGFHGLSYAWIAHVLKQDHPTLAAGRVIAAHLGNGASLCAMKNGASIDTTMSMTTLDGVPMGTRSGAIDAGAVTYMIREQKLGADAVEHMLYEQSGLKGLSGLSNDVKNLLNSTDPGAKFALDYFALYVAKHAATMAVSLGGIDGFVFTGGIGEHAAPVREGILSHLKFMNIPQTLVIPANEERMMAMQAMTILAGQSLSRLG